MLLCEGARHGQPPLSRRRAAGLAVSRETDNLATSWPRRRRRPSAGCRGRARIGREIRRSCIATRPRCHAHRRPAVIRGDAKGDRVIVADVSLSLPLRPRAYLGWANRSLQHLASDQERQRRRLAFVIATSRRRRAPARRYPQCSRPSRACRCGRSARRLGAQIPHRR